MRQYKIHIVPIIQLGVCLRYIPGMIFAIQLPGISIIIGLMEFAEGIYYKDKRIK